MGNYRIIYILASGVGCLCGLTSRKKQENILTLNALDTKCKSHLDKYGLPKRDVILRNNDFEISFDNRNRLPNWVLEHLTFEKLKTNATEFSNCDTQVVGEADKRINGLFKTELDDYHMKDFSICQLADNKNHKNSEKSFKDCHKFSNFALQTSVLHCFLWNDLETYARFMTVGYKDVYVFTGPLFIPKDRKGEVVMRYEVAGNNHLAIPTHFFKVIIGSSKNGNWVIGCYVLPNEAVCTNESLSNFRVSLEQLELYAGFKLFKDNLPFTGHLLDVADFREHKEAYMRSAQLLHVM